MERSSDYRDRLRRRWRLRVALAAALVAAPLAGSEAADAPSYAEHTKTVILRLLAARDFAPAAGCEPVAPCAGLLALLRAGDFAVVEPAERSDRPDLPSYLRARKRCPGIDPARITVAHRVFAATRDFAAYRLDLPQPSRGGDETFIFRAQHYVQLDRSGAAAVADGPAALLPGTFIAMGLPSCRLLAAARGEDGDWFAKHNAVADGDHASELLRLDGRYVVLNLAPIAAPRQPKAHWWYVLELWDLGAHADADRRGQCRVYSFGYKPAAPPLGLSGAAAPSSPG
ncbi:MAG: hypothetical protein ACLQJR_18680 [Stellaceae bacterium]